MVYDAGREDGAEPGVVWDPFTVVSSFSDAQGYGSDELAERNDSFFSSLSYDDSSSQDDTERGVEGHLIDTIEPDVTVGGASSHAVSWRSSPCEMRKLC